MMDVSSFFILKTIFLISRQRTIKCEEVRIFKERTMLTIVLLVEDGELFPVLLPDESEVGGTKCIRRRIQVEGVRHGFHPVIPSCLDVRHFQHTTRRLNGTTGFGGLGTEYCHHAFPQQLAYCKREKTGIIRIKLLSIYN